MIARRAPRWVKIAAISMAGMLALGGTAFAANAGALPPAVQDFVAAAVAPAGIDLPSSDDADNGAVEDLNQNDQGSIDEQDDVDGTDQGSIDGASSGVSESHPGESQDSETSPDVDN